MIYVSVNEGFVVQNIILHYSAIKGSGNLKIESGNTTKAIISHLKKKKTFHTDILQFLS